MPDAATPPAAPPPDWRTALPEDMRALPVIKDVPDLATLVKNYGEAQSFLGNSIRVPGPDAGDDARKAFRERLVKAAPELMELPKDPAKLAAVRADVLERFGFPKDPAAYSLEGVSVEGVELDQVALRKDAAELGLDKEGFKKLAAKVLAAKQAEAQAVGERKAALKATFGAAFDERMSEVRGLVEKTNAPAAVREALQAGTLDPAVATWMVSVARSLGAEPREAATQAGGRQVTMTPSEAQARISEIRKRPEVYNRGMNPEEHTRLVGEMARLYAFAYPELVESGVQ